MEYISFIVIKIRKIPKLFFKIFTSILREIFAPIIAPKTPKIEIIVPFFKLKLLFFILTKIEAKDAGIKNIKLIPCDICCSIPIKKVSNNINITNVSQLLGDFSEKVLEQEKIIQSNLDELNTFLESQIAEYETLNSDAQTRLDATAAQLDSVASNANASIEQI